jgi:excisionase family DNA binding protein
MKSKQFLSTSDLARLLGISRIAVFKRIKKGEIKAQKVGRNFVIDKKELGGILEDSLSVREKRVVDRAVDKTVKEYGETLKLLGNT